MAEPLNLDTIYDYLNDRGARPYERLRSVDTDPLPDAPVTREVLEHFLNILPPGDGRRFGVDFYVIEAVTGDHRGSVYSAYLSRGPGGCFHRYIFIPERSAV